MEAHTLAGLKYMQIQIYVMNKSLQDILVSRYGLGPGSGFQECIITVKLALET